ncbi:MAG: polyamine aminopropyltransferase [Firmicutes bacterium]|nr:polyamine aminopropyltransferase [Bacillota bacterium]
MELWFTEKQTEGLALSLLVTRTLHRERTPFQDLAVLETVQYGRLLVLDGVVMLTEADEFIYHETIAHVPLLLHPEPRIVLVIGGGDGGTVREVLKHPSVEKVVLAEIDERVIEASRRFFPTLSTGFTDPRLQLAVGDGIEHVRNHPGTYDVILVDSTDPVGPGVGLFEADFYRMAAAALRPGGLLAAQTESPFVNRELIRHIHKNMKEAFPFRRLYLAPIPTYPAGWWSFTLAAEAEVNPLEPRILPGLATKYYTPEVHRAAFALPPFVAELVRKE